MKIIMLIHITSSLDISQIWTDLERLRDCARDQLTDEEVRDSNAIFIPNQCYNASETGFYHVIIKNLYYFII